MKLSTAICQLAAIPCALLVVSCDALAGIWCSSVAPLNLLDDDRYEQLDPANITSESSKGESSFRTGPLTYVRVSGYHVHRPGEPFARAGVLPPPISSSPLPLRVEIVANEPGARPTKLCEREIDISSPASFLTFQVESDVRRVELQVRYSLTTPLPADARVAINARSTTELAAQRIPLQCPSALLERLNDDFDVSPLTKTALDAASPCHQRLFVTATDAVLVSLKRSRPDSSVKFAALFKRPNEQTRFSQLCVASIPADSISSSYLVGLDPSLPFPTSGPFLWGIEVERDCDQRADFAIEIQKVTPKILAARRPNRPQILSDNERPLTPGDVVSRAPVPAYVADLRLSCVTKPAFASVVARHKETNPAHSFVDLIVERKSGALTSDEKQRAEDAALNALAAWTKACRFCGTHHLAIARVNGRYFASSLFINELNGNEPTKSAFGIRRPEKLGDRIAASAAQDSLVPAYVPLTAENLTELCKGGLSESLEPGIRCIDGRPQKDPTIAVSTLKVVLVDGFTSCDRDVDTIACERDGVSIELNSRDYSFSAPSNEIAFGTGKWVVPLDLVIAHEIGHWLGIGHLSASGSLMSETAELARCIGDADVLSLEEQQVVPGPRPTRTYAFRYQ